jgi:hypothetical protein
VVVLEDDDTFGNGHRIYIGSLPEPRDDPAPEEYPPPGVVAERLDVGSGPSSGAFRLLTLGPADESLPNRVLAELTTSILDDRIFSVIREELGATYGGSSSIAFEEPGDLAELFVSVDGDPARIDEIALAVFAELETVSGGGITEADFDEAVTILESRYNFIDNGFLIDSLFDEANASDDRVRERGAQLDALGDITQSDVATFVDTLFSEDDRIDIRNVP